MQQLLTGAREEPRREGRKGGTDGWWTDGWPNIWIDRWMDGWMTFMDVCFPVTVALQENRQYFPPLSDSHASLRRSLYLTVRPFDTLFISVSPSLSPSPTFLCLPRPLSSRLSPTFSSPSLIYYSHPLSDSFFLSHDTWNPSVRCRAFRPPTKSASLSGKGIGWWIKEQSKETDKKLRDGQLYRYVSHRASSLYRLTFNTVLCVILLKDRFKPR